MPSLHADLTALLNRYSAENGSDTPDFILATFLLACLAAFNTAQKQRSRWYAPNPAEPAPPFEHVIIPVPPGTEIRAIVPPVSCASPRPPRPPERIDLEDDGMPL